MGALNALEILEQDDSIPHNTTRQMLQVLEEYKTLELQAIVSRQSSLKKRTNVLTMMAEVDQTTDQQQTLIEEAAEIPVTSMRDVMDCFALWHADVVCNNHAEDVKPIDRMLKNMFVYLHEHQF